MQTLRAFFHNNKKGDMDKDWTHKDKDRAFKERTRINIAGELACY